MIWHSLLSVNFPCNLWSLFFSGNFFLLIAYPQLHLINLYYTHVFLHVSNSYEIALLPVSSISLIVIHHFSVCPLSFLLKKNIFFPYWDFSSFPLLPLMLLIILDLDVDFQSQKVFFAPFNCFKNTFFDISVFFG